MSNDKEIEKKIIEKGLTAPRVTTARIAEVISQEYYFTAGKAIAALGMPTEPNSPTDLLTICVLVLKNGFIVTGESACASPENFDKEIGEQIAKGNAVQKIWGLEGYVLRNKLAGI